MVGPFFAFVAALLFGISAPLAKVLVGSVDPWLLASLLYLGSGLGMMAVHTIRHFTASDPVQLKVQRAEVPWLAAVIFFGGIAGPVLLMFGLARTSAAESSLLLNLEGVLTALIAWMVFKEHYDRRIVAGMSAILLGGCVLTYTSRFNLNGFAGPLLIFAACSSWAVDNNLTRKISLNDPILLTTIKCLGAGATNLVIAIALGAKSPEASFVIRALFLGFVCYGLSIVFFILALRFLGASRTGAYFSVAPFIGALVAILVFSEPVTLKLVAAATLMAFGVYLHLTESHEHVHEHTELEHDHFHSHDEHHQHEHDPADELGVDVTQPHAHKHRHSKLIHRHAHFPDMHHTHEH